VLLGSEGAFEAFEIALDLLELLQPYRVNITGDGAIDEPAVAVGDLPHGVALVDGAIFGDPEIAVARLQGIVVSVAVALIADSPRGDLVPLDFSASALRLDVQDGASVALVVDGLKATEDFKDEFRDLLTQSVELVAKLLLPLRLFVGFGGSLGCEAGPDHATGVCHGCFPS
jgi:hypothetical protein